MTLSKVLTVLRSRQSISLCARSHAHSQNQWNYRGEGNVEVIEAEGSIIYQEHLILHTGLQCHDTKRWSLEETVLKFERYRQGIFQPLFQFPIDSSVLSCLHPHWCQPDTYAATLAFRLEAMILEINISGPKKAEILTYTYK